MPRAIESPGGHAHITPYLLYEDVGAADPEGHHWYFAQHVRDVAPEDMNPPL